MKEKITGAQALMRALQAEGVKTIFGYPGGSIMPVYDALYDYTRGEKKCFDHILVRHEQAATHAAEGFARVSGEVGVALVTSGPGATNTLTGVADAMLDSTPIVVIAGQVAINALGTDAFQEVDLVGVAQPISKWSYQIRHAEDIAWAVSRAFYIARSGRPGPVVLDFARNAQVEEVEWEPVCCDFVRSYVPYPKLDIEKVKEAADLINNAKRPLALVGQGVELGNAQEELKAFLEKADIPAGRTMLGLSALSSEHPLNVGMLGMHGNYAVNLKEQECDVLIAIGMRFSDRVTGNTKTYAKQAKIIHLDIDRSEIDKCIKTDVAVVADCKESLPALTALIGKADHREWRESFKELDNKERVKVIEPAIHPAEGPLLMGEVVNAIDERAPRGTVL
ncbi:MAG: thiamine pyrophosphate-binding protein, partial [Prevotella sp.]|nr:thiamine pyrophosphate-binding protein [Prevotella sp.]